VEIHNSSLAAAHTELSDRLVVKVLPKYILMFVGHLDEVSRELQTDTNTAFMTKFVD
jgi:hypothetical protein